MRFVAEAGLWAAGPDVAPPPAVAVLEVNGAVLAWTVNASTGSPLITFTDVGAADWLWRLIGPAGHAEVVGVLGDRTPDDGVQLDAVELLPESVDRLRRLATGHWLRRWWPASLRDGIVSLDQALLDGELALLTAQAQDYFSAAAFDAEVHELLAPHRAALLGHERSDDPRVQALVEACVELADDVGAWAGAVDVAGSVLPARQRDDYALAAGGSSDGSAAAAAIASGTDTVSWVRVPPGVFDAADRTVEWSIRISDGVAIADVRAAVLWPASAQGVKVRLRSGAIGGAGVLDAEGHAILALVDVRQQPVVETAAWNHDWSGTAVIIGVDDGDDTDPAPTQLTLRDFVRARLATPGADALLAEQLAAESDY